MTFKKIFIFGPPGSGKSYWVEEISKKLNIPIYDMDDIRFIKKFSKNRPEEKRKPLVDKVLKNKKWIIDSKANDWDRHAMLKADIVIWMCAPFYTRAFRIAKRYLKRRKDSNIKEGISDLFFLINYSWKYRFGRRCTSFNPIKRFLNEHNIKPVFIKSRRQMFEFVEGLS